MAIPTSPPGRLNSTGSFYGVAKVTTGVVKLSRRNSLRIQPGLSCYSIPKVVRLSPRAGWANRLGGLRPFGRKVTGWDIDSLGGTGLKNCATLHSAGWHWSARDSATATGLTGRKACHHHPANRDVIARFEKKIQATLSRIWGDRDSDCCACPHSDDWRASAVCYWAAAGRSTKYAFPSLAATSTRLPSGV